MSAFLITIAILLMAAITVLLRPLLSRKTLAGKEVGESPALAILREQRKDLDADLAAGRITAQAHAQTLGEIEQRALEESAAPEAATQRGAQLAWATGVGVALPFAAVLIYLVTGTPAALDPAKRMTQEEPQVTSAEIDAMVARVAERVKANPDDLEALQMLGRSYMVLSRFKEAAAAFAELAKKKPEAQVYADWADAVAGAQDRKLDGEPAKLIAKALELDPSNIKALALSGTIAFSHQDYKAALQQWEQIAARVPAESEFGQSVRSMIAEARNRAGMPAAEAGNAAAGLSSPATSPVTAGLNLKGHVSIAAALKNQVGSDDALFVFVRPAAGGPPLAGLRLKASELPVDFDFTKAQMMMGSAGPQDKLIVGARISKSGNAMPASGDLQGFSGPVTVAEGKPVRIEISEHVK